MIACMSHTNHPEGALLLAAIVLLILAWGLLDRPAAQENERDDS